MSKRTAGHAGGIPRALVAVDPARATLVDADVLVVGSGVAGLSLALALPPGLRVLLATKGPLSEGATRYAQGGIAAALPGRADAPDAHLADTLAAGAGLCDVAAVRVLVDEAPGAIADLLTRGVRFDTEGGELALTREGGHSRARIVHAGGDATGAEVERALIAQVRAAGHVRVAEHAFLVDLLTDASGAVTGAALAQGGDLTVVRAGAVVLASGGAGQLFPDTTNPPAATGDGIAAALRAGAELADLEFVQFHPTALHLPGCRPSAFRPGTSEPAAGRPRLLLSEALRGEGAVLRDTNGDAVMDGVHPLGDLAPRDVVSRAMATRMAALGSDHLLLDATALGAEKLERRFPTIVAACRAAGLDPARTPLPVSPAAHYLMGGIRADLEGRTSLPGLWAVGEAACTGVHGANRLASNSLLEGAAFAARGARALTEEHPRPPATRRWATPLTPPATNGEPPASRAQVRAAMGRGAGVVRSAGSLADAASALTAAVSPHGDGTRAIWETANLAQLGTGVTYLARLREESRGAHWRHEFPEEEAVWAVRQTITRAADGSLTASRLTPVDNPAPAAATPSGNATNGWGVGGGFIPNRWRPEEPDHAAWPR